MMSLIKKETNYRWGNFYCKSIGILRIGKYYFLYFHWHIGRNDIFDGFRMRVSEFMGKPFTIPFMRYEAA